MFTHPYLVLDLASTIHAERIAEAQRWRTAARVRRPRTESRRPAGPSNVEAVERHLGWWLSEAGNIVAGLSTDVLERRRSALEDFIRAAVPAARRGGVDLGFDLEPGEPVVVLNRIMGILAARLGVQAVPVSGWDRARLDTALRALTGAPPTPDSDWELAA